MPTTRALHAPETALKTAAAVAAKSLQSCPTLYDTIDRSPPLLCPWDSPGKNTGVGCHFLLQCMKVKSESEVAQSCSTLSNPMDCSPPGSSIRGIFQARVLEWGVITFSGKLQRTVHNLRKPCSCVSSRSLLPFCCELQLGVYSSDSPQRITNSMRVRTVFACENSRSACVLAHC